MDTSSDLFEACMCVVSMAVGWFANSMGHRRRTRASIQAEFDHQLEDLRYREREHRLEAEKESKKRQERKAYEISLLRKLLVAEVRCVDCEEEEVALFYERMIEMGWVTKVVKIETWREYDKKGKCSERETNVTIYELTPVGRLNALCPLESDQEIIIAVEGEVRW